MNESYISYREYGIDGSDKSGVRLSDHPEMRVIQLSLLSGVLALLLIVSIIVFVLPIDQATTYGLLGFAAIFGSVVISVPLLWYEALVKARYRVTTEYIEAETGFIAKAVRTIPLSYVRDVTYEQGFIQAMFGVSTITVSATNGDKIRLQHVRDGKRKRELIWNLVLSKTPGARREA